MIRKLRTTVSCKSKGAAWQSEWRRHHPLPSHIDQLLKITMDQQLGQLKLLETGWLKAVVYASAHNFLWRCGKWVQLYPQTQRVNFFTLAKRASALFRQALKSLVNFFDKSHLLQHVLTLPHGVVVSDKLHRTFYDILTLHETCSHFITMWEARMLRFSS